MKQDKKNILGIIGLGYVGLPLAYEFSKYFKVVGFDINKNRVKELKKNFDENNEFTFQKLKNSKVKYTFNPNDLNICNIFIVTVPTPVLKNKNPDLKPLINSSSLVAKYLKKNSIVIYESTVFPGCTEEVCVPILNKYSGLKYNVDYFCGYSPERINFGDKKHTLTTIKKITSGSNLKTANIVNKLYSKIISAGTYKAKNIKVAETAKAIENTQRDLNIALVNEFAMIFDKLNIKTKDVLNAALTKWNFLDFKPGLVGGHCIGVDPYYLTYKSKKIGYNPKLILRGRKINDEIPKYISNKISKKIKKNSRILFLGATFKSNIPDYRNSKAISLYKLLIKKNKVDIFDPLIDATKLFKDEKIKMIKKIKKNHYDVVIISVQHNKIKKMGIKKIFNFGKKNFLFFDIFDLFQSKNNQWSI
jgi:nucleotide sugar dehydrogenase